VKRNLHDAGSRRIPVAATDEEVDARRLYSRITWRLIPFIFLLYIVAYLDRVNVGFAGADLKRDLSLSDTVFGLGGGIYFAGQFLFDLPSNLLMVKVGPRVWIARIMITWGVVATAMMFISGARSFYVLRFLLGVGEAGFFPGMILYLTYWFPSGERARAVAKFMTATSIAGVVGGPMASALLRLEGVAGLHGWQWLFLLEGLPAIALGVSVLFVLNDGPANAGWLSVRERTWLAEELERDRQESGATHEHGLGDALRMPMVWVLGVVYALCQLGIYTLSLWMPLLLRTFVAPGGTDVSSRIARYAALPYVAAAVCTVLVGWSSDRFSERRWHMAACLGLGALGFTWAAYAHSLVAALGAMTLAAIGYWSMMGPFWALPARVLGGRAAAGGVAMITMVGSIGAFAGPALTGKLKDLTHDFRAGLLTIAGLALVGGAMGLLVKPRREKAVPVEST
jgi:ACS family tartrate transporter-like MFS transporter